MSPDCKIAVTLMGLSPLELREITKWLGVPERDYAAGESELQHICMILITALQSDRLYRLGDRIDFVQGRAPEKWLTTTERRKQRA